MASRHILLRGKQYDHTTIIDPDKNYMCIRALRAAQLKSVNWCMLMCSGQDGKAVATPSAAEQANGAPPPATEGPVEPSAAAATLPPARAGATGTLPGATVSATATKSAHKLPEIPARIRPPGQAALKVKVSTVSF